MKDLTKWIKFKRKKLFKAKKRKDGLILFLSSVAVIMVWRGVWNLLDIYLFPGYPITSAVFPMFIGILFLLADDNKLEELE